MGLIEEIKSGGMDEVDLLEYVTDNDIAVAIAAAESPAATEPVLDIAAHDKDRRVRIAALGNPNIGNETLGFLCGDADADIAKMAAELLGRRQDELVL